MPTPLQRFNLDPTGTNPDNKVVGEVYTLTNSSVRAVPVPHGAFFTSGLVIHDHSTNILLTRGVDYQCSELLQEATLKFGKEICLIVIILNPAVSSQVRLDYQVLGGLYQNPATALANIYNTNMSNDGPVDWINVLNKPIEYPPALHNHLIQDVYGFEALTVSLERVRNAIVLSNIPAFESLIDWVKNYVGTGGAAVLDIVTAAEVTNMSTNNKVVTFERLLQAMQELNFNAITFNTSVSSVPNAGSISCNLSSTNFQDGIPLYWTIEHVTTTAADFTSVTGTINIFGNKGSFVVPIAATAISEAAETFRIAIRRNSAVGPILTKSGVMTIEAFTAGATVTLGPIDYFNTCCMYNPTITINPASYYIVRNHRVRRGV